MKNNPAVRGFVISVLLVIFAFGIYFLFLAKKNYYLVDNPSQKTFYFKINGEQEEIIAPGQTVKVKMDKGNNKIAVFDENKKPVFDSAFQVKKIRGLINISHQDYYVYQQYYGYNLNKDSLVKTQKSLVIDGRRYLGGARLFNKLYTDDFYYNIDEDYDQIIKNIADVESRTKIFRKQDFINYYKSVYKN
ncbi:hypothetical protein [Halpernia frigidisoli]|uniref:Uncharacterized protein n=1 Tax=Halpernia frigidisoli TaxID=1125876 RepID=A0A1I3DEL8_9FLAO|nr:hypothetical protein [Halpernia frigidisoli]SFH84921.1 hypothetical protein SAMN05443292_0403 [Halpernia frigidisoli]